MYAAPSRIASFHPPPIQMSSFLKSCCCLPPSLCPLSLPMTSPTCYDEQITSGLYDSLVQKFLNLDKALLSNLEWSKDIKRDPADHRRLLFSDGRPFTTLVFGEIAPQSMGSLHSAVGNHYMGSSRKPVRPGLFIFLDTPNVSNRRLPSMMTLG